MTQHQGGEVGRGFGGRQAVKLFAQGHGETASRWGDTARQKAAQSGFVLNGLLMPIGSVSL
jgi:hypothetical protein